MKDTETVTLDEIIDNLTVGHIGWAYDQLDGTSYLIPELELIESRHEEAKASIIKLIESVIKTATDETINAIASYAAMSNRATVRVSELMNPEMELFGTRRLSTSKT